MERNLYDIPGVSDFDERFPIMVYPGWHASGDTPKGAMEAYPSFEDRQPRQGMAWIHRRLKEVDATVGSYWTARQEVYGVVVERRYIFEASWMTEKGVSAFLKDQSEAKRALAALTEQEKALVDLEKARTSVRYPGEMFLGITSGASGFPREFFRTASRSWIRRSARPSESTSLVESRTVPHPLRRWSMSTGTVKSAGCALRSPMGSGRSLAGGF